MSIIMLQGQENLHGKMEAFILEMLLMEKDMGKESIIVILINLAIKVLGIMDSSKEKEYLPLLMDLSMKENFKVD